MNVIFGMLGSIMESGPNGNERAWTGKRLLEDKGWDAGEGIFST